MIGRRQRSSETSITHTHGGRFVGQIVEVAGSGKPFLARVVSSPSSTVLTVEPIGRWSAFWWRAHRAICRLAWWRR